MLCIGAILQAISGPVILGEAKLQRSHRGCSEFRLQAALLANVTSDRGPAKAGTPNYVHPARKIITQRVVKPDHDSVV
jgi:hypothetical protein